MKYEMKNCIYLDGQRCTHSFAELLYYLFVSSLKDQTQNQDPLMSHPDHCSSPWCECILLCIVGTQPQDHLDLSLPEKYYH